MKNIFTESHTAYKKELKKLQKDEQQKMFNECKDKWEEFMQKVYKNASFKDTQIKKLEQYTSAFAKKNNKNLSLPFALLDQVVHFYITDDCTKLYIEPIVDSDVLDEKLLNQFFSTINAQLFQENMPFRWHHNSFTHDAFWIEIKKYRN